LRYGAISRIVRLASRVCIIRKSICGAGDRSPRVARLQSRSPLAEYAAREDRSPVDHAGTELQMTFVVTENCIKCKYMDCVEVCPVDCFHEGPNFLVIDPDECIDCTLCEPECPAEAIFSEEDVPSGQQHFLELNADLAKSWPVITERKEPPPDAKEWDGRPDKLELLER